MSGYSAAHAGYNQNATGPEDSVSDLWRSRQSLGRTNILCSPVVEDDHLYIGCGKTVYALDLNTGAEQWSKEVTGMVNKHTMAVGDRSLYAVEQSDSVRLWSLATADGSVEWKRDLPVASPPTPHEDRLYLVTSTDDGDEVRALNSADGEGVWRTPVGDPPLHYGRRTSPAVQEGTVYTTTTVGAAESKASGRLHALNAADGAKEWQFDVDGEATRAGAGVADGTVYFGDSAGVFHAVDASEPTERWRFTTDSYLWSTPAIAHGRVYVGAIDGTLTALDRSGNVEWETNTNLSYTDPVAGADTVYTGGPSLRGIEAETGEVQWKHTRREASSIQYTSPTVIDDAVAAASCIKTSDTQRVYDDYVTVLV